MGHTQEASSFRTTVADPSRRALAHVVHTWSVPLVASVLLLTACSGTSKLRVEAPPAEPPLTTSIAPAPAPAPSPEIADTTTSLEPQRHQPDPVGLDEERASVLAVHRQFWDAYVPPDRDVQSPDWPAVEAITEAPIVNFFRNQFDTDVNQDGGLTLHLDLRFDIASVTVDGSTASVSGCVQRTFVARSFADGAVMADGDERNRYLMTLTREPGAWMVHNVEVADICPA